MKCFHYESFWDKEGLFIRGLCVQLNDGEVVLIPEGWDAAALRKELSHVVDLKCGKVVAAVVEAERNSRRCAACELHSTTGWDYRCSYYGTDTHEDSHAAITCSRFFSPARVEMNCF